MNFNAGQSPVLLVKIPTLNCVCSLSIWGLIGIEPNQYSFKTLGKLCAKILRRCHILPKLLALLQSLLKPCGRSRCHVLEFSDAQGKARDQEITQPPKLRWTASLGVQINRSYTCGDGFWMRVCVCDPICANTIRTCILYKWYIIISLMKWFCVVCLYR